MRNLLFTLILFMSMSLTQAQSAHDYVPKYYLQLGVGPTTHNGVFSEVAGTVVFKNKWTASVSYQNFDMTPSNLPSDYEQGYTLLIWFPIPDEMPSNTMKSINFTAGKYFPLSRKTWITGEAGLAITNGDTFTFTRQQVEGNGFYTSSNYDISRETKTGAGAIAKVDFNWAFVPYVGLSFGAFANVNSIQTSVGLQFKLIVGWMNTKKKIG